MAALTPTVDVDSDSDDSTYVYSESDSDEAERRRAKPSWQASRLAEACYTGNTALAEALVAGGAGVNDVAVYIAGWENMCPPLVEAVRGGHLGVMAWLLERGADPNGRGVMFTAAVSDVPGPLQLLIDVGGDIEHRGADIDLPLMHWAIHHDLLHSVQVLLAEPSLSLNEARCNYTVMDVCSWHGSDTTRELVVAEDARRNSLSSAQLAREHHIASLASVARLAACGLGHLKTPAHRVVLRSLSFAWISACVL